MPPGASRSSLVRQTKSHATLWGSKQHFSYAALSDIEQDKTLGDGRARVLSNRSSGAKRHIGRTSLAIQNRLSTHLRNRRQFGRRANRATINLGIEKYEAALTDFNQALLISPGDAALYLRRGQTHLVAGEIDLARPLKEDKHPVCGMAVKTASDKSSLYNSLAYFFCSTTFQQCPPLPR